MAFVLFAGLFGVISPVIGGEEEHLIQLLTSLNCPGCQLADVDLTHVDLRDANLQGAQLRRANLSQAELDGADLSGVISVSPACRHLCAVRTSATAV